MKKILYSFFVCRICTCASLPLYAEETQSYRLSRDESPYDEGSRAFQVLARYLQGAGVGYKSSYTTLEWFISPARCYDSWVPFMDLRGHAFNNGTFAANVGLGLRYVGSSVSFGINTYYDYRETKEFHYNQVGVGLEAAGSFWGVNINGYIPVGKKKSPYFNPILTGDLQGPGFAFFQGNNLFLTTSGDHGLLASQEFAFTGVDSNAFFRILERKAFALDFGIGPYYFHGSYNKFAVGGKASLTVHCTDYLYVSVNGSYDNLFRLRGQIGAGISIPLGPKSFGRRCRNSTPSYIPPFYDLTLARAPSRNEVIVVDDVQKTLALPTEGGTQIAINSQTGQPYFIIFVNNTSGSDGTFKDPYPTIQEALLDPSIQEADMIYVYEGDGSPYDVDNILLIDDLMLLGAGIDQTVTTTVGPITIPAQSSGFPTLQNTVGTTMLTFANHNTVSGFTLDVVNAGDVVVATFVEDLLFAHNKYQTNLTTGMNNMVLTDCVGDLFIEDNQFIMLAGDTGSVGIVVNDAGTETSNLSISGNSFINHASAAINLTYTGTSSPTVNITGGNIFNSPPLVTSGINITTSNVTVLSGAISNQNSFTGYSANTINLNWDGTGLHTFAISGNTISSHPEAFFAKGVNLFTTADNSSLTISNNQFSNQLFNGINCFASNNAAFSFVIDNNTLTAPFTTNSTGIQIGGNSNSILTGSVTNNKCNDHKNYGINVYVNEAATIAATIDRNQVVTSEALEGNVGIGITASNTSFASSSYIVSNNRCSGQVGAGIQSFPNNFSEVSLNISNNTLVSARNGATGINTYGVQIGPGNDCQIPSLIISNNKWTGPATYQSATNPQGFQVGIGDQVIVTNLTVSGNTATLPFTSYQANHSPIGMTLNVSTDGIVSNLMVSRNSVVYPNSTYMSEAPPQGIHINTNDQGTIPNLTISSNSITYANLNDPSVTNFYPNGIQVNSSGTSSMGLISPVIIEKNSVFSIGGSAINLFANGSSTLHATIDSNRLTAQASGIQTNAINASASDTSTTSYVITNNICLGHSSGAIQGFPKGDAVTSYVVSNNFLTAIPNGIANSSAVNIQISPNGKAAVSSTTISGNVCRGPATYQASGTPQSIQFNVGDDNPLNNPPGSTASNLSITGNMITMPFTSYVPATGVSAIGVNSYGSGHLTGVVVSSNTITYPNSTYVDGIDIGGIQVGVNNGNMVPQNPGPSMQGVLISQNTITFAPLQQAFTSFGTTGISVSADSALTELGSLSSPVLVQQNTITRPEGNGITVNSGSDSDIYVTVAANNLSLGTVSGNTIGIAYNMGGTGQLRGVIDGNRIEGNHGAFFGIVTANLSPSNQYITIQNNTVTNIHANNDALPLPDLNAGGAIGNIPLNSGDLTVLIKNNGLSGNTPQGTLGIVSSFTGGTGSLCLTFDGNHGVNGQPADSYRLYHIPGPYPASPGTLSYYDAGNNAGTFIIYPNASAVIQLGPGQSCPIPPP